MWRQRVVSWGLAVLVVAGACGQPAFAQTGGGDVFATAGPAWMWNDESYIGTGGVVGAGLGYRIGRVGLELLVDHRRHRRHFDSDVLFTAQATRAAGRVLLYLGGGRAEPYVGGLVGLDRIDESSDFPDDCEFMGHQFVCRSRRRFNSTDTSRVLAAVAGVRVPVRGGWFVRPEFEFGMATNRIMMSATVGIGRGW